MIIAPLIICFISRTNLQLYKVVDTMVSLLLAERLSFPAGDLETTQESMLTPKHSGCQVILSFDESHTGCGLTCFQLVPVNGLKSCILFTHKKSTLINISVIALLFTSWLIFICSRLTGGSRANLQRYQLA